METSIDPRYPAGVVVATRLQTKRQRMYPFLSYIMEKYHNSKDNILGRNPLFPTSMIVGGRATANLRELIVSRLWFSQMQQFDQYLPPGILHLTYLSVTLSWNSIASLQKWNRNAYASVACNFQQASQTSTTIQNF